MRSVLFATLLAASTAAPAWALDLCVTPATDIVRTWAINGPTPQSAPVALSICGEGPQAVGCGMVPWTAMWTAPWLDVAPAFGTLLGDEVDVAVISFQPAGLHAGTHETLVQFQNVNDHRDSTSIRVRLHVVGPEPNLSITADEFFSATHSIGGAPLPTEFIAVENVGPSPSMLAWVAETVPPVPWLVMNPTSGLVGSIEDRLGPDLITVNYLAAGVAPGVYETDIVVSNVKNPADFEVVPVSLTIVDPTPDLELDDSSAIHATFEIGGLVPPSLVRVAKNVGHPLSYLPLKVETVPNVAWLTMTPTSGYLPGPIAPPANELAVDIGFAPLSLTPGLYMTTLRFENVSDPMDRVDVDVTLVVTMPGALLALDDTSPIAATYVLDGPVPADVVRVVSNAGPVGSMLEWALTETPDVPWLHFTPPGGTLAAGASEPAKVQFAVAGVDPGLHVTTLRFQNLTDAGQFLEVPVALEVIDPISDLCLDEDQTDITAVYEIGGPMPGDVTVLVKNCGHDLSTLTFGVLASPPAGWLTITPTSGVLPPPTKSTTITLAFDPTGLVDGTYTTELRLQNLDDPLDFELLRVDFVVGNILFRPGDRIVGGFHEFDAAYELEFDAVQGMKIPIKMKSAEGEPPAAAQVSVIDPDGAVVVSKKLSYSEGKAAKTTLKMKANGRHRLRIEPFKNRFGNFILNTKRVLPKKAGDHKLTKAAGDDLLVPVKVLALPDANVSLKVVPKGGTPQLVVSSVETPDGTILDTSGLGQSLGAGAWLMEDCPADECGAHVFRVTGFGGPAEKAKVKVMLEQPPKGTASLILPIL